MTELYLDLLKNNFYHINENNKSVYAAKDYQQPIALKLDNNEDSEEVPF
jgi:hypothetical protein